MATGLGAGHPRKPHNACLESEQSDTGRLMQQNDFKTLENLATVLNRLGYA
jgi:hypothetical protein